jgi:hypothetical protein
LRAPFFACTTALGKILTLGKCYIIVVDLCCLCKKSGETVDHLLLHCELVSALWNFFGLFGLVFMPRRVRDLFACWRGKFGSPLSEAVWKMISLSLMWYIWRERNDRNFEDRERKVTELKRPYFNSLFHWIATYDCFHIFGFHDFFFYLLYFFG